MNRKCKYWHKFRNWIKIGSDCTVPMLCVRISQQPAAVARVECYLSNQMGHAKNTLAFTHTVSVAIDANDMVHFVCVYWNWNWATLAVIDLLAGEFSSIQCTMYIPMWLSKASQLKGVSDSVTDWEWNEQERVCMCECLNICLTLESHSHSLFLSLSHRLKCDSPFNGNISC